jgi:diguanylate cyclase (GGDEF)-like protein
MTRKKIILLGIAIIIWGASYRIIGKLELAAFPGEPIQRSSFSILLWLIGLFLMVALAFFPLIDDQGKRKLRTITVIDPLTGLYNRRAFIPMATPLVEAAEKLSEKALVLLVSIDDYDKYQKAGKKEVVDKVVTLFADAIRDSLRGSDLIARYNEDEFACFMPKASLTFREVLLDRISGNVAAQSRQLPGEGHLSASIGFAELDPVAVSSLEKLIKSAYDDLFVQMKVS